MSIPASRPPEIASAHRTIVLRLLQLADDTDRAGLGPEASILAALAYSMLDSSSA